MKNAVYVGGGFSQDQLIWIIPIVCEKYSKTNIDRIIFEELPNSRVLKNKKIKKYLSEYEIINQRDLELFRNKYLKYFYALILNFLRLLILFFFINRNNILDQKNWFKCQFNHAFGIFV